MSCPYGGKKEKITGLKTGHYKREFAGKMPALQNARYSPGEPKRRRTTPAEAQ